MQFHQNNPDRPRKGVLRYQNQEDYPEGDYGEMDYADPNINQPYGPEEGEPEQMRDQYEQNMEPIASHKSNPVYQTFRGGDQPGPVMVNIPTSNEPQYEQSPKTINLGNSRDEDNYNIRTLNARRSPGEEMYDDDQYDEGYDNDSQPRYDPRDRYQRTRSPQDYNRSRDLNPYANRTRGGVIPMNRMSPSQNFDELDNSGEKFTEGPNYNKNNRYGGAIRTRGDENYTMQNPNQVELENPRDDIQDKYDNRTYNNMSYKDVKRLAKKFNKMYDPNKNNNGLLVEENQVTVPGADDEVFNNRYKVLSKMNRLSNILLAKQRRSPTKYDQKTTIPRHRDNSFGEELSRKTFNRKTLANRDMDPKKRHFSRSPDHKFLYVSLAMLSSKGPNVEDRIILRRMRLEKGGVVDLAQEDHKKNKFQIKKAIPKKGGTRGYSQANPKYREAAAKLIQEWWRNLKDLYDDRLKKIIKIQSVWRGKFVRKYMYDLFYLNFLYISFCKKIENVLTNHVRPYVWKKLFEKPKEPQKSKEKLLKRLIDRDYRNDKDAIEPYWRRWVNEVRKDKDKYYKIRNLVQIRNNKENDLSNLRNAFNKWRYNVDLLKAEEEYERSRVGDDMIDRNENIRKIKGLFKILEGVDKITKKEAMEKVVPKLEDYLNDINEKEKLKKIIDKKPDRDKNLLRKYLYQWYANTIGDRENSFVDHQNELLDEIRRRIFRTIVERIRERINENLLRKYFLRWLRKTLALDREEEKNRLNDLDKLHNDKEREIGEDYDNKLNDLDRKRKEGEREKAALNDQIKNLRSEIDRIKSENREKANDEHFLDYLRGCEILQRAVWRMTHKDPLNAFGENLEKNKEKYLLLDLIRIKKEQNREKLRRALYKWKNNCCNRYYKKIINELFAKILEITSMDYRRKLLRKKFNQWRRKCGVKSTDYNQLKKARALMDLMETIRKANIHNHGDDFIDRLKKSRNFIIYRKKMVKMVKNYSLDNIAKLRRAFDKWRSIVKNDRIKEILTRIIYEEYIINKEDKNRYLLNKYFQRWKNNTNRFNYRDLEKAADDLLTQKIEMIKKYLRRVLTSQDKNRLQDLLRRSFNKWRMLTRAAREPEIDLSELRVIMLRNLVSLKDKDKYITLLHYLLRWRNKAMELKNKASHKPYKRTVIKTLLTKNDKEELQRAFNKWRYGGIKKLPFLPYIVAKRFLKKVLVRRFFKEFVRRMNARNPRLLRQKGEKLMKILKRLLPYEDFIDKLRMYIIIKRLRMLQPNIHEKVKLYYLKKYFDHWREVAEDAERKKKLLADWIKEQYLSDRDYIIIQRKKILTVIMTWMENYRNNLLCNSLLKWRKNAKLTEQIEHAEVIQNFCRKVLDKVLKRRLEAQRKLVETLYELYRKKFFEILRKICDYMRKELEKRRRKMDKLRRGIDDAELERRRNLLRKYFNKWRRNLYGIEDRVILIQKLVRMKLARNKLKKLYRLRTILFKIYERNENGGKDLLLCSLRKWRKNAREIECDENARIIQDFCRRKLDNYMRKKFLLLLLRLKDKYLAHLLNTIAKMDKLNKALRHRPLTNGMDALKKIADKLRFRIIMIKVMKEYDENITKYWLKYYLEKWRKKANQLKEKELEKIRRLQAVIRGYLFRNKFWRNINKIRKLKYLVEKHDNDYLLRCGFAKWRKIVAWMVCDENARIIQDFCRKIHAKINRLLIMRRQKGYNNLAYLLYKLTISPQEFFDRLKKIYAISKLKDLAEKLNNKRLDNLKYAYDKIKEYPKKLEMYRLLLIRIDYRKRLLKEYLDRWREKALRRKNIMIYLLSLFNRNEEFYNNLLHYSLLKWLKNARYRTQKKQAIIICEFCIPILERALNREKWRKLARLLRMKKSSDDIDSIIKKIRYYFALQKAKKPIVHRAREDVMDLLKKYYLKKLFGVKYKIVIEKVNRYNSEYLLREYFERWREIARRMKEKEDGLGEVMEILERLRNKKATPNVEYASIIKNLFHDYPLMRALVCLRRLRDFANYKNKNDNLANDLVRARDDLKPKLDQNLIKKLYKVYAYKVLDKMFENFEKLQRRKARPFWRALLIRLIEIKLKQSETTSRSRKNNETEPTKTKTSFRLKKPVQLKDDQKKKLVYTTLTPYLIKMLQKLFIQKKKEVWDVLTDTSTAERFCELYKKWALKRELKPKRDLVDNLKKAYEELRWPYFEKLYKLLRILYIKKTLKGYKDLGRLLSIMYVIRVTIMEKGIAKERWIRMLIRRWRYIAFSKKLAVNKMKSIYKNLHMSYLEVANSLFGEEESKTEGSIIKEFERFGTSVGMWENEKPEYKEEEKYVKETQVKYVFDDMGFEEFEAAKYGTTTTEVIEEENRVYVGGVKGKRKSKK